MAKYRFRSYVKSKNRSSRHRLLKSRLLWRSKFSRKGIKSFLRRRRRHAKPEIKYVDRAIQVDTLGRSRTNYDVSVPQILQGTDRYTRIGASVKIQRIRMRAFWETRDPTPTTFANAGQGYFRHVLWTPRIDYTIAQNYMDQIEFNEQIDWNVVTVVKDEYVPIWYDHALVTLATNTYFIQPAGPVIKQKKYSMAFPRNVKFAPTSNNLNIDKDILYGLIINPNLFQVRLNFHSRTMFIDP